MHYLWWGLTIIFIFSAFVGLVRLVNHQIYKRSSSITTLLVSLVGVFLFFSLATHLQGSAKAGQPLTPDQKVDKDLENIIAENVLNLTNQNFSKITVKNDTDKGTDEVGGIVSGIDQSGKKVEYDFSAYTDDGDMVQWSTENTSTYKTETGTVNTSNGEVKIMK